MMTLDALEAEHRVIEKVLTALDRAVTHYVSGGSPDDLTPLLDFCQTYGDASHHEKEEHLLFPALARRGVTAEDSMVAALSAQHESCRQFLHELRTYLDSGSDDPTVRRIVTVIAR